MTLTLEQWLGQSRGDRKMPVALTNVIKGTMNANADSRLRLREGESIGECRARFRQLLANFREGQELADHAKNPVAIGDDRPTVTNASHEIHAREEFLGQGERAFFPRIGGHRADQIVRGGYIRAIEAALGSDEGAAPKPIVTYWVITGRTEEDPGAFELFVAETPNEVHVLILTPQPAHVPTAPPARHERVEDMWVVSTSHHIKHIAEEVYPKGYTREYVPIDGTSGVDCLRVVAF
jgi:hypothetical protein